MHRDLEWLHDYWRGLPSDTGLPARSQVNLDEIGHLEKVIVLVEVIGSAVDDPASYRFRFVGADLNVFSRAPLAGMLLRDLPDPEAIALLLERYAETTRLKKPISRAGERTLDGIDYRFEYLSLPLSDDGETVDMILSGVTHKRVDEA